MDYLVLPLFVHTRISEKCLLFVFETNACGNTDGRWQLETFGSSGAATTSTIILCKVGACLKADQFPTPDGPCARILSELRRTFHVVDAFSGVRDNLRGGRDV
jgi:hypothetical protein